MGMSMKEVSDFFRERYETRVRNGTGDSYWDGLAIFVREYGRGLHRCGFVKGVAITSLVGLTVGTVVYLGVKKSKKKANKKDKVINAKVKETK